MYHLLGDMHGHGDMIRRLLRSSTRLTTLTELLLMRDRVTGLRRSVIDWKRRYAKPYARLTAKGTLHRLRNSHIRQSLSSILQGEATPKASCQGITKHAIRHADRWNVSVGRDALRLLGWCRDDVSGCQTTNALRLPVCAEAKRWYALARARRWHPVSH